MRQIAYAFISFLGALSAAQAVPVYLAPDRMYPSGHYSRDWLRERTRSQITQRWLKVRAGNGKVGWTVDTHLLTKENLLNGAMAYVKARSQIKDGIGTRANDITQVAIGDKVDVVSAEGNPLWVKVRVKSRIGYMLRQDLILASDIPEKSALVLTPSLPIRHNSVPYSDVVARLERFETVHPISAKTEDWGQVATRKEGQLWWPMNETASRQFQKQPTHLKSSQLFKRRLYDMAASPLDRQLKIASAQGIFRTIDGERWTQVQQFRDQDHPIAIAPSGRIFVGPYFSDDQGVTFTEYIRWDKLIDSLARLRGDTRERSRIQILEVKPSKNDPQNITVTLDLGGSDRIVAMTTDLGGTWAVAPK